MTIPPVRVTAGMKAVGLPGPAGPTIGRMRRSLVERSLRDVHQRLVRARQELAVLEEQLLVFTDTADDARIRSLVSETPLQQQEYSELSRHVSAANAEMTRRSQEVRALMTERDELLREWKPKDEDG